MSTGDLITVCIVGGLAGCAAAVLVLAIVTGVLTLRDWWRSRP